MHLLMNWQHQTTHNLSTEGDQWRTQQQAVLAMGNGQSPARPAASVCPNHQTARSTTHKQDTEMSQPPLLVRRRD